MVLMPATIMGKRIVVKFGGALITKKDEQCVAHTQIIRNLCSVVKSITEEGIQVIIVHGAGSFGHLKAKRWRLNEGYIENFNVINDLCSSQFEAVRDVRNDMLTLNEIVLSELEHVGLNPLSHPPHKWASNLGPQFDGDLSRFGSEDTDTVHVSFGDVVDVDDGRKFLGVIFK